MLLMFISTNYLIGTIATPQQKKIRWKHFRATIIGVDHQFVPKNEYGHNEYEYTIFRYSRSNSIDQVNSFAFVETKWLLYI